MKSVKRSPAIEIEPKSSLNIRLHNGFLPNITNRVYVEPPVVIGDVEIGHKSSVNSGRTDTP